MKLCIEILCHHLEPQFQSGLDPSTHQLIVKVLIRFLRGSKRWPPPPNWHPYHWDEELRQAAFLAALRAQQDHDPARGASLVDFLRHRVHDRALDHYRNEWAYAAQCSPPPSAADPERSPRQPGEAASQAPGPDQLADFQEIRSALETLSPPHRLILSKLFLEGRTEADVAAMLNLSQRGVNKRKQAALKTLRERLTDNVPGAPPAICSQTGGALRRPSTR